MARSKSRRRFGGLSLGRSRWPFVLVAVGALLLAGGAAANVAATPQWRGARIINREAARGVHPDLQRFLDLWEERGPFDVRIGQLPGFPGGALRTASDAAGQAAACTANLSDACDLASTPHGRGAALDLWPEGVGFNPYLPWDQWTPEVRAAFQTIGEFAEAAGLTWGGRWRSNTFPHGDQPHVELKNWRSLPYPPPAYGAFVVALG